MHPQEKYLVERIRHGCYIFFNCIELSRRIKVWFAKEVNQNSKNRYFYGNFKNLEAEQPKLGMLSGIKYRK